MKIRTSSLAILLLLCTFAFSVPAMAKDLTAAQKEVHVMEMKQRVDEIRAMDLSHMSKLEKKEIRSELKQMKSELRANPTYIYISGGALLLIIIILILIL